MKIVFCHEILDEDVILDKETKKKLIKLGLGIGLII